MLASLLLFGLLLGFRHALEADHIAAVAALASRARSLRDHVKLASAWGVGHASTLFVFGAVILVLDLSLPDVVVRGLEGAVGIVLIGLGIDVLRRARRDHVHFHLHQHDDGTVHVHAHAHDAAVRHDRVAHAHEHPRGVLPRALLVGSIHGLAGSAALVLIPLHNSASMVQALAYLAAFGVGSIVGMVVFSVGISVPLRLSARHLGSTLRAVEGVIGMVTIVLGCWITATVFFGPSAG